MNQTVEIEIEHDPNQKHGEEYRGRIISAQPATETETIGSSPGKVRAQLQELLLKQLESNPVQLKPGPRTWREALPLKLDPKREAHVRLNP